MEDRWTAIRWAVGTAQKNDCIVVAGKGAEDFQEWDVGFGLVKVSSIPARNVSVCLFRPVSGLYTRSRLHLNIVLKITKLVLSTLLSRAVQHEQDAKPCKLCANAASPLLLQNCTFPYQRTCLSKKDCYSMAQAGKLRTILPALSNATALSTS